MHEEELTGGNTGRVVRIDGTVRRETGPWTPAVHELLRAWEAAGIAETPRVIGVDEQGREILSFLEGEVLAGATPEVRRMMVQRLEALADYSAARADATGHADLRAHAAMYRRDAARIEAALGS